MAMTDGCSVDKGAHKWLVTAGHGKVLQWEKCKTMCSCTAEKVASKEQGQEGAKGAYPQDPLSGMYKVARTCIGRSTVFWNFAECVRWVD